VSPVTRVRWVTFGCVGTLVDGRVGTPSIRPFDDVECMLAELRANGFRLAVLTNSDDEWFEKTHRTFRRPFDLFVTSERVRGYKPAQWHFRAFEQLTRVSRRDWVHVASSWHHDIAPAKAFGLNRVWLDRARTSKDPSGSVHVYNAAEAAAAAMKLFAADAFGPSGRFAATSASAS
jgi:FMN phosphatase YigB (HAD superfamily)